MSLSITQIQTQTQNFFSAKQFLITSIRPTYINTDRDLTNLSSNKKNVRNINDRLADGHMERTLHRAIKAM